jgi:hypothetical protein
MVGGHAVDDILYRFLEHQRREVAAAFNSTQEVRVAPDPSPLATSNAPDRYLVELRCRGLVWDGRIREHDRFLFGVVLPPDYLQNPHPVGICCVIHPLDTFHPNTFGPLVCMSWTGGMSVRELVLELWALASWQKVSFADPLNPVAADWGRRNQHRLPIDRRPLRLKPAHEPKEATA